MKKQTIVSAFSAAGFQLRVSESRIRNEVIFSAGPLDFPLCFKTWEEAYEFIEQAEFKLSPGAREAAQAVLHG